MMKKLIGKKRKRENSCFFPEKLFNILQNKNNQSIINWDKEGKVVVIENKFKFSKLLEKYFKGQNHDSFIRQLNLYGFEKLVNIQKSDKECFSLENFTKNSSLEEIRQIKRKKMKNNKSIKIDNIGNKDEKYIKENNEKIDEILNQIKNEKDDYIIIEKYKSIIQDDKIDINKKFIANILKYLNKKKEELRRISNNLNRDIKKLKFSALASNFDINKNEIELNNYKKSLYDSKIVFNRNVTNELTIKKPLNLIKNNSFRILPKNDNSSFNKCILNALNTKDSLKVSIFSSASETPEFFKKSYNSEIKFD